MNEKENCWTSVNTYQIDTDTEKYISISRLVNWSTSNPTHLTTAGSVLVIQNYRVGLTRSLLWMRTCLWTWTWLITSSSILCEGNRCSLLRGLCVWYVYFHYLSIRGESTCCRFYAPLWQASPTALTAQKKQNWNQFLDVSFLFFVQKC